MTLFAVNGGPGRGGGGNRAVTVPKRAPHTAPTSPWCQGLARASDRDRPGDSGQGKAQPSADRPSLPAGPRLARPDGNWHTRVLGKTQQDGSSGETQPPRHNPSPSPKGRGPESLCTPHTGRSPPGRPGSPSHPDHMCRRQQISLRSSFRLTERVTSEPGMHSANLPGVSGPRNNPLKSLGHYNALKDTNHSYLKSASIKISRGGLSDR